MNDPTMPDWRLIDAYLAGEASNTEQEAVRRWMTESPANAAIIEQMRAALSPMRPRKNGSEGLPKGVSISICSMRSSAGI